MTKIDLPTADPEPVLEQMEQLFGMAGCAQPGQL